MIDWDAPDEPDYTLIPIEQLHAEAAIMRLEEEAREAAVKAECLRWWAANPERYLSLKKHYDRL